MTPVLTRDPPRALPLNFYQLGIWTLGPTHIKYSLSKSGFQVDRALSLGMGTSVRSSPLPGSPLSGRRADLCRLKFLGLVRVRPMGGFGGDWEVGVRENQGPFSPLRSSPRGRYSPFCSHSSCRAGPPLSRLPTGDPRPGTPVTACRPLPLCAGSGFLQLTSRLLPGCSGT